MKRKIIFPIMLSLIVMLCAIAFAACDKKNNGDNVTVHTIIYVNNYNGGVTKAEVEDGASFTLEQAPVRPGYTFAGWYLGTESDSEQFTADYKLEKDVTTVFAKWTKNENEKLVTYKYLNYVTDDLTVVVGTGSKLEKPDDPRYDENDMFAFDGWFTDIKCTQKYNFDAEVSSDITLYAGWKQDKIAVLFNYNYTGSPAATTVLVSIGGTITPPEDPVRDKYDFDGWYTARVGGEKFDFENGELNDGDTLYAQWIRNEFTVTFNLNGGAAAGVNLEASIKRGQSAEDAAAAIEQAAKLTGHVFAGWYTVRTEPDEVVSDDKKADLSSITSDLRVYAKWNLREYTVNFNYNYSGAPAAPASQPVKYNRTLTAPTVADRSGYIFAGWFIDTNCTTQFTLNMPVTDDMTLYAKWADASKAGTQVTVTFKYSINGTETTHQTVSVDYVGTVADKMPANPTVDNYYFADWYTDSQFTTVFNPYVNLTEEKITVYGKMLKKYTFEAEATDFEGKEGQGTSTNSKEEGMIYSGSYVEGGNVSNGYFVREMYYNGAYLEFEIEVAEEVFDAVIYLRVSSESYEFFTTKQKDGKTYNYLSSKEYQILVNEVAIDYDGLYMPMANLDDKEDLSLHKTPFEDCFIAAKVHLEKGTNYITLLVSNNNNHGGTFHAEAPTVDCMYIYSSAELTMHDYLYYTRPGVIK